MKQLPVGQYIFMSQIFFEKYFTVTVSESNKFKSDVRYSY